MRTIWLLPFALVLPLQMSWAAVHACDDAAVAGHSHAAATGSGGEGASPEPAAAQDDCCAAAHGCHGLHHPMAPASLCAPVALPAADPVPRSPILLGSERAQRHERPQWSAA